MNNNLLSPFLGPVTSPRLNRASQSDWFQPRFPAVPKTANAAPAAEQPSFETALQELESIVESKESGDQTLEQLLARYDRGTQLARLCQSRLSEAEVRIQTLETGLASEPKLKPFVSSETQAD